MLLGLTDDVVWPRRPSGRLFADLAPPRWFPPNCALRSHSYGLGTYRRQYSQRERESTSRAKRMPLACLQRPPSSHSTGLPAPHMYFLWHRCQPPHPPSLLPRLPNLRSRQLRLNCRANADYRASAESLQITSAIATSQEDCEQWIRLCRSTLYTDKEHDAKGKLGPHKRLAGRAMNDNFDLYSVAWTTWNRGFLIVYVTFTSRSLVVRLCLIIIFSENRSVFVDWRAGLLTCALSKAILRSIRLNSRLLPRPLPLARRIAHSPCSVHTPSRLRKRETVRPTTTPCYVRPTTCEHLSLVLR